MATHLRGRFYAPARVCRTVVIVRESSSPETPFQGGESPARDGTSRRSAGGATDTGNDCASGGKSGSQSVSRLRSAGCDGDLAAGEWLPGRSGGFHLGGRIPGAHTPYGPSRFDRNITAGRIYHKCPHGRYINEFDYACQLHFNRTLTQPSSGGGGRQCPLLAVSMVSRFP